MKRKVLCTFSLLAYLLLFCTVFSPMAQREMTVLATVKQLDGSVYHNNTLSIYTYCWGQREGLFHIVEGTGWNSGDRIAEIDPLYYTVQRTFAEYVSLHPGTKYTIVLSATKAPQVGDPVKIVETTQSPGEKLIVYTPNGATATQPLQNNFTILQQGEKGILMDSIRLEMPFFEHQIQQSLAKRFAAEGMRLYSYTEAESFLRQLPMVALLTGLLLVGFLLWAGTCGLTKKQYPPALLWINFSLTGLTLLPILLLSKTIDLPASLMPQNSFLDIGHYVGEFRNIFAAMDSAGDESLFLLCRQMLLASAGIILAATVFCSLLLFLENKWRKRYITKI